MEFEFIRTPRLSLRKITPEAYDFVHNGYSDLELMNFFALADSEALEKEKSRFKNGTTTFNKKFLWFQLLTDEGKNIGQCGYHTWYIDHARAELFYGFGDDAFAGKGLMHEAMAAVLNYGFDKMGLHRVEAMIADYNSRSLKIIEKFNFVPEGRLRQHYFVDGKAEDSLVFSLLRHEHDRTVG